MVVATHAPGALESAVPQLVADAVAGLNEIILGKERQIRLCLACLLARGHLLIEDIPGVGKTTLAHALARIARPELPAHPVHERPAARGRDRRLDLRAGIRPVPLPPRPGVRAAGARRRGEPRDAQGAERVARGDGGAPGHGGRPDIPAQRAVLRDRDAESRVPDRHVSAAGVAARPVPDADRARLSGAARSSAAAARQRPARPARGARAGDHAAAAAAPAGRRAAGARCRRAARLRAGDRAIHAAGRRSSRPGCRRAPSSRCCARRRPGRSCTPTPACCRRMCRQCCRPWSGHRLAPREMARFRDAGQVGQHVLDSVPVP